MRRVALIAAAVLVALLACEIVLRIFGLAPTQGLSTVTETEYRRLPGLMSPNENIVLTDRITHRVETDSLGYRGANIPRRKPAGEHRIVVIGDSFTWGDYVENDETLPAQLETVLNQQCNRVRVINAGVGGTTILGQDVMAERSLVMQPDVIVLTFYANDVRDLDYPYWYVLEQNRRAKSRFPLSVLYPALRKTALWHLSLAARGKLRDRRVAVEVTDGRPVPPDMGPRGEERREAYISRLRKLADKMRAQGIDFVFATFPSSAALEDPRYYSEISRIIEMSRSAGIKTVDLTEPLRASGLSINELFLLPVDDHASRAAYALAASHLSKAVIESPTLHDHCAKPLHD